MVSVPRHLSLAELGVSFDRADASATVAFDDGSTILCLYNRKAGSLKVGRLEASAAQGGPGGGATTNFISTLEASFPHVDSLAVVSLAASAAVVTSYSKQLREIRSFCVQSDGTCSVLCEQTDGKTNVKRDRPCPCPCPCGVCPQKDVPQ